MAEKVYCIVKRNGNYYIPIKARYNPYVRKRKRKKAYLACLPNFFGGKMEEADGSFYAGLVREVAEESQDNIQIATESLDEKNCIPLYQFNFTQGEETDFYQFYLVIQEKAGDYFEGDKHCLDMKVVEAKKKEMSCILKIPVNDLAGKSIDDFLGICKSKAGKLVDLESSKTLVNSQWKTDEGTKDAFERLLAMDTSAEASQ